MGYYGSSSSDILPICSTVDVWERIKDVAGSAVVDEDEILRYDDGF